MATTPHNALTGSDLHEPKGAAAALAGQVYVANGSGSGVWTGFAAIPVGIISPYGGATAPSSWLLCYGQAISRVTYAALFAVLSTSFGVGNGTTTFNLPDLRGRVPLGKDDMGGVAATRVSTAGGGLDGLTLGAAGGAQSLAFLQANLPSATTFTITGTAATHTHGPGTLGGTTDSGGVQHTHNFTAAFEGGGADGSARKAASESSSTTGTASAYLHTHTFTVTTGVTAASGTLALTGTAASGGSDTAMKILNPGQIVNYIIYTSV